MFDEIAKDIIWTRALDFSEATALPLRLLLFIL